MVVESEYIFRVKIAETKQERDEASRLIVAKYEEEFGVRVPPAERQIIVLFNENVVGTAGLEFPVSGKFPLEEYFDIQDERFSNACIEDMVEFTRWASRYPHAGEVAVIGLTTYALSLGKKYAILSVKDKQLDRLRALGANMTILVAKIRQSIPDFLIEYYAMPPYPKLIMVDIEEFKSSFLESISKFKLQKVLVRIDF